MNGFTYNKYDTASISRLKNRLLTNEVAGRPIDFEILVDYEKAIPRTKNIKLFDTYLNLLSDHTRSVTVIEYEGKSKHNTRHIFLTMADDNASAVEMGLNGIGEQKVYTSKDIEEYRRKKAEEEKENQQRPSLEKTIAELTASLEEKNEYILKLETDLGKMAEEGEQIGGKEIGEFLRKGFDFVLRNKAALKKFPMLNGIAGMLDGTGDSTESEENKEPETEMSFKRRDSNSDTGNISAEDREYLSLIKRIATHFSKEEFEQVIDIMGYLQQDKQKIIQVLELVK